MSYLGGTPVINLMLSLSLSLCRRQRAGTKFPDAFSVGISKPGTSVTCASGVRGACAVVLQLLAVGEYVWAWGFTWGRSSWKMWPHPEVGFHNPRFAIKNSSYVSYRRLAWLTAPRFSRLSSFEVLLCHNYRAQCLDGRWLADGSSSTIAPIMPTCVYRRMICAWVYASGQAVTSFSRQEEWPAGVARRVNVQRNGRARALEKSCRRVEPESGNRLPAGRGPVCGKVCSRVPGRAPGGTPRGGKLQRAGETKVLRNGQKRPR